jgi:hypothetical protein
MPTIAQEVATRRRKGQVARGGVQTSTGYLPAPKKKKGGKSFWGHLADPFINTEHAIAGIPGGLYHSAASVGSDIYHHPLLLATPASGGLIGAYYLTHHKNPLPQTTKNVAVPLAQSYRRKYGSPIGKMVHGNVLGGARLLGTRMFVDDPLGTVGDVATALSLGTAGAVRVGMLGGKLSEANKVITLRSGDLGVIRKPLAGRTELGARVRLRTDKTLKAIDARREYKGKGPLPVVGEQARYARAVLADEVRVLASHTHKAIPYLKARRKLTDAESVAADVMHDFPTHDALAQYKSELEGVPEAQDTLALLNDPKVMKAFDEGTKNPRIKTFLEESAKLGAESSKLAKLLDTTVLHRRYMPMLMQRGAAIEHLPFKHVTPEGGWDENAIGKKAYTEEHGVGTITGFDPETGMVQMKYGGSKKITKEKAKAAHKARVGGQEVPPPPKFEYPKEVPFSALRDPVDFKIHPPHDPNDVALTPEPPAPPAPPSTSFMRTLDRAMARGDAERVVELYSVPEHERATWAARPPRKPKPPPVVNPEHITMEHPEMQPFVNARRKIAEADAQGLGEDFYQSALGTLGRRMEWSKYPSKREAVIAKLDSLESQARKRIARTETEALDPVNILKQQRDAAEAVLNKARRKAPKKGRTEEERAQFQAELDALGGKVRDLNRKIDAAQAEKDLRNAPKPKVKKQKKPTSQDFLDAAERQRVERVNAMIEEIQASLGDRPEPLYRPHTSAVHDINPSPYAGGGVGPTTGKVVRQTRGFLLGKGRVLYGKDTLAPMYMRVVRRELSKARHVQLLKAGHLVDAGTSLAELEAETGYKWRYIRQTAGDRPTYIEQSDAQFSDALSTLDSYKKGERMGNDIEDELTTTSEEDALMTDGENIPEAPGGMRVVVPDKMVKHIAGEFQRSTHAAARSFRAVTNAWRTLVLNLRLGWLVNNVVGNTGLYFLQNTGPGALRSLLKGDLTADDIGAHLGEHLATGYGTQMPASGRIGRALERATTVPQSVPLVGGRALTRAPEVLRNMDIRYEQRLRRATIDRALNASPELKQMTRDIKNQTKSMRELKVEALQKNPLLADKVSAEAYRTMGNFSNMTPFEQNVVRQVVPFYAWYRAITKIALQLPLDNPIRTAILAQIGNEGFRQDGASGGPLGSIPLGGGYIMRTTGVNPLMTIPQTVGSAATMARAGLGGVGFMGIKPPSQRATAFAAGIGNPILGFPLTGGLSHTIQFLPEVRLANPPKSKLYQHSGRTWQAYLEELAAFSGIPVRKLKPVMGGPYPTP